MYSFWHNFVFIFRDFYYWPLVLAWIGHHQAKYLQKFKNAGAYNLCQSEYRFDLILSLSISGIRMLNVCRPEVFNTYINIQCCISETQQNFIVFIIVLGQHVSILTELSSGPSKKTHPYLAMFKTRCGSQKLTFLI